MNGSMKHQLGLCCLILTTLITAVCAAQSQPPTDDCNQGFAEAPLVDPRSYWAICFPQVGTMSGDGVDCKYGSEDFGRAIASVLDVNHDDLMDWVISHARCDTIFTYGDPQNLVREVPIELLLYKGVRGRLPDGPSGERIGPHELGSATEYLASGDWDGDGYRDIATRIHIYGDTSHGNVNADYTLSSLVIFWGGPSGYSVDDTTHLACDAEMWFGPRSAASADFDRDGHEDLFVIGTGAGYSSGHVIKAPSCYLFTGGTQRRWGRNGVQRTASWRWWVPPSYTSNGASELCSALDQDGDGAADIVLYSNQDAGTGHLSVLYGKPGGGLPDTSDVETVDLKVANGHFSLFSDITGDGIPELLLSCGNEQQVKVFIGLRGQRLAEQYGTGNDSAHPGSPVWWGKPWARLWLPNRINGNWTIANHELFDAGDGNRDGLRDIWAVSDPFALCYASGSYMDSLVDGLVYEPYAETVLDMVNLGDIDGSGLSTIAVAPAVGSHAGRVIYIKPDSGVIGSGEVYREPVPGTGPPQAGVSGGGTASAARDSLILTAAPNPSAGDIRLVWSGGDLRGGAIVTVIDLRGAEVARFAVPAARATALWPTSGVPRGAYLLRIAIGERTASTTVAVH